MFPTENIFSLSIFSSIKFSTASSDGKKIKKGSVILKIKGSTRSILIAERTALNFLGLMSGIATNQKYILISLDRTE